VANRGPGGGGGRLSSLAKTEKPTSARATVLRLSRYLMPMAAPALLMLASVVALGTSHAAPAAVVNEVSASTALAPGAAVRRAVRFGRGKAALPGKL